MHRRRVDGQAWTATNTNSSTNGGRVASGSRRNRVADAGGATAVQAIRARGEEQRAARATAADAEVENDVQRGARVTGRRDGQRAALPSLLRTGSQRPRRAAVFGAAIA